VSLHLGGLVKSFVDGFVMPIIGLILPSVNWENATVWIFKTGMLLSALITFLMVCMAVFLMVKAAKR